MTRRLTSRKFLFPLVAAVTLYLSQVFGLDLDPEIAWGIVASALGFAGVEGAVDRRVIIEQGKLAAANAQADALRATEDFLRNVGNQPNS